MLELDKKVIKTEFAINLRRFRNKKNLTQEKLAEKISVTHRSYQRYEEAKNPTVPTLIVILSLLKVLEIDLKDLVKY